MSASLIAIDVLQNRVNAEVGPIAQKMDKEMGAVLTPAQRDKFKKLRAEQMRRMQQMKKTPPQQ